MKSTGFRFCVWTGQKYEKRKAKRKEMPGAEQKRKCLSTESVYAGEELLQPWHGHKGRTGGIGDGFQTVVCYLLIQSR